MTWHRPDGSTYRDEDADHSMLGIPARALPGYMPPQAPEKPEKAPELDRTPVHPARDHLMAVLDRIKAGELAATLELPGALAAARKERNQ